MTMIYSPFPIDKTRAKGLNALRLQRVAVLLESFEILFKDPQRSLSIRRVKARGSYACNKALLFPDNPLSLRDKAPSLVERVIVGRHTRTNST